MPSRNDRFSGSFTAIDREYGRSMNEHHHRGERHKKLSLAKITEMVKQPKACTSVHITIYIQLYFDN